MIEWTAQLLPAPVEAAVLAVYVVSVVLLSLFGMHRLHLVLAYFRHRDAALPLPDDLPDDRCPHVLVQLPIFNERFVIERLLSYVAELDWPRDRLHIQVLDDSTDDTVEVSRAVAARLRDGGLDVEVRHRVDRTGFKAGALQAGIEADAGRSAFVAIFDADFLPPADFLRKMLAPFDGDDELAMVQARWAHINRNDSLLTRAQAVLLDGHFVMEHGARFRAGRFFNFNGTAGVWRIAAIEDAGGWQGDTLTEDLDLSYRAQLAGWRFAYLQDLAVPSELPADARAFKSQQHRWAKGSIQVARKLLPTIWRSALPVGTKLEATAHLANNLAYPLMVVLLAVLPLAVVVRAQEGLLVALLVDLPVFVLATLNLMVFYALAEREVDDKTWLRRLPLVPFVLGVGASLTPNQARAVWEAMTGHRSPFVRTPKAGNEGAAAIRRYRPRLTWQPLVEIAWGLYFGAAVLVAAAAGLWISTPFMAMFAAAFLLLGVGSLLPAPGARPAA
jgi:cellulose synthase/poly-beta-1,6-N-acetylglucosamine synthase-like glycosyltransferase